MISTFLPEGWMAGLSAWLIFNFTKIGMERTFLTGGWIVRLNAGLIFNFKLSWLDCPILPEGWIVRFNSVQWYSTGMVTNVVFQLFLN